VELEEIGRKLKVQAVVMGTILPRKDGFTLSVELVDVAKDSVLWSGSYDTNLSELQNVQLAISREICAKLRVTMTAQEEKRFVKRYTDNVEAYNLYLQGLHHFYKFSPKSEKKAEDYFLLAIQKDPKYALAYAGLSVLYTDKSNPAKAKQAALTSLALDGQLAEAHMALGILLLQYDLNWSGAERELKHAVELNPSLAQAWDAYFMYLLKVERVKEAEEAMKNAIQLEPMTPFIIGDEVILHYYTHHYDQAIRTAKRLLDVDADDGIVLRYLGMAYAQNRQPREALDTFQMRLKLHDTTYDRALVAYGHAVNGEKETARKMLDELTEVDKQSPVNAIRMAVIHLALKDKNKACDWLDRAYKERSQPLTWLKVDPVYDSLRSEPRFIELMKKMNFP
jgi:tetratricopeptide (TPR) repeat protein